MKVEHASPTHTLPTWSSKSDVDPEQWTNVTDFLGRLWCLLSSSMILLQLTVDAMSESLSLFSSLSKLACLTRTCKGFLSHLLREGDSPATSATDSGHPADLRVGRLATSTHHPPWGQLTAIDIPNWLCDVTQTYRTGFSTSSRSFFPPAKKKTLGSFVQSFY